MAKTKISEFSATPSDNTDIDGINIAEGCAPSGINNAIRELMSQLKDQQTGASGDSFTVGGNLTVTGTSTLTGNVLIDNQLTINDALAGDMINQNKNAVDITGGTIAGTTITGGTINSLTTTSLGTNAYGTRTVSTSSPTGGSNGDIWYKV